MENIVSKKIYGNDLVKEILLSSSMNNRLSHSYLFYGSEEIGKKTISYFLASLILCSNKLKPCYECTNCQKLFDGHHPDFHIIEKDSDKTLISIDIIRKLRINSFIKANDGVNKVFFINNAHLLSNDASNALLKILEEPSVNTFFILTTTNKQLLPETILSRCISLEIFPVDKNIQKDILKTKFPDKTDEEILYSCIKSNGNIGQAKLLLESSHFSKSLSCAKLILSFLHNHDEYSLLSEITKYKDDKVALSALLVNMIDILHEEMLLNITNKIDDNNSISIYIEILEQYINKINSNININLIIANLTIDLVNNII